LPVVVIPAFRRFCAGHRVILICGKNRSPEPTA
jgi:hypothetical protein